MSRIQANSQKLSISISTQKTRTKFTLRIYTLEWIEKRAYGSDNERGLTGEIWEKRKKNAGNLIRRIFAVEREINDIFFSLVCLAVVTSPHVLPSFPIISHFPSCGFFVEGTLTMRFEALKGWLNSWLRIGGWNLAVGRCRVFFHATLRQI